MKNNFRQRLHLEPRQGWLNDPNGLSFFGGKYHFYFQYSPDNAYGKDDMCWGHWESADMINWSFTGTVLRPDIPEDRSGVYSGCGLAAGDTLHLFYTGNVKKEGNYDYITSGRCANVIHVTTRDGHNMSTKEILLTNADYPDFCSCHVRDPKVWEQNGHYRMALGARTFSGTGCVLLYRSDDLLHWELETVDHRTKLGYMWECPDMILLGDKEYLSVSVQGAHHSKYRHQNVYSSGYFDGDIFHEWDHGFDFYAPQTFVTPDGRRVMVGWMGISDIPYFNPTAELGWQHCFTQPRELTVSDDGSILQNPIRELEQLRSNTASFCDTMRTSLPFELAAETNTSFSLSLDNWLSLTYSDGIVELLFKDMKISGGRTIRRARLSSCSDIRIIADTTSLEIYLDGGRCVMSTRFYPPDTDVTLSGTGIRGTLYSLNSIGVIDHERHACLHR